MITLSFYGNLVDLLRRHHRRSSVLLVDLQRDTSVKDVVESFGVPHPEIEKIVIDGEEVGFAAAVHNQMRIEVFPVSSASDFLVPSLLRPEPLRAFRFIVDANVRKLGVKLRQLGFDTLVADGLSDERIAAISGCQRRILLTRDRGLLKRKVVDFGHLVRAKLPLEQVAEVISLYNLRSMIKPCRLCLRCNGILVPVNKEDVLPRLEPLTRRYYDSFHQCNGCGRVYWYGSHRETMNDELRHILELCDTVFRAG